MKKLSLLLVVLLAAGSAGLYGQMAIGTNFSISGDATATAGYDIDDEQFGFKNESSANIKIEFVAKQSSHKPEEMMSGWYGSIELNDFQIIIDSDNEEDDTKIVQSAMHDPGMDDTMDTDNKVTTEDSYTRLYVVEPTIVATLKNGPLFLKIFAAPDNKADLVPHIEDDDPDDNDYAAMGDDDGEDVGREINKGHGITVGYDTADLSLAVGISSEEPYDDDDKGSYAVSADLGVNVGPAKLDISFVQGLESDDDADPEGANDTGVGAKLTTTFGDIELSAGADVEMSGESDDPDTTDNESMDWEAGANAKITLTPNTSLTSDFIFSSRTNVASDVLVEISDKSGLVESLDMSVKWGMFDLSGGDDTEGADSMVNDEADMLVKGSLDYHLADTLGGTLTPGTSVTINQVDGEDAVVELEVRAVLTDAVPLTTFGASWKSGRLVDAGDDEALAGTVKLWTKIKY